jgi:hypothetical protein
VKRIFRSEGVRQFHNRRAANVTVVLGQIVVPRASVNLGRGPMNPPGSERDFVALNRVSIYSCVLIHTAGSAMSLRARQQWVGAEQILKWRADPVCASRQHLAQFPNLA